MAGKCGVLHGSKVWVLGGVSGLHPLPLARATSPPQPWALFHQLEDLADTHVGLVWSLPPASGRGSPQLPTANWSLVGLHPTGLRGLYPALRQEKEPRVCDRDIHGLMDGEVYTSRARSWSNAPSCAPDDGQDMVAVFAPGGKERLLVTGGIEVRLVHGLPGKPAEGHAPHRSFDKNNH